MDWQKNITWVRKYFPELTRLGGNVRVELDLSIYATKATGADSSKFAKNVDVASL